MNSIWFVKLFFWLSLLLYGCQASPAPKASPTLMKTTVVLPLTRTISSTATSLPSATPAPSPTLHKVDSNLQTETLICSPMAGISLADLETVIFNPFDPPAAGTDGPHQGVDFADLEPANRYAREGLTVQAVLTGKVAAVIDNRFPYGNALLIETTINDLSPALLEGLDLPIIQLPRAPHPALTCPDIDLPDWSLQSRSLYLLYAHLLQPPQYPLGEPVNCGQALGAIGSSGNALNPHLHLEIRLGPSEARFISLAHYDSSASPEEMANYCTWRVSGMFQLIDPLLLIHQGY